MSAAQKSSQFSAAYVKNIRMLSLNITPGYVGLIGYGVLWLSITHRYFREEYIFTSDIWWPVNFCQPTGGDVSFSIIKNEIMSLCISLSSAFFYNRFWFFLLILDSCSTFTGISMPYLWAVFLI